MKLTREQKAAVAKIIESSAANARHRMVHADSDEKRNFYQLLIHQAETLLPIFQGGEAVEIEIEDEEEDEEDD